MSPKGLEEHGKDTRRPGVVPSTDEAEPKPNNASLRFAAWHQPTYLAGAASEFENQSHRSAVLTVSCESRIAGRSGLALTFPTYIKNQDFGKLNDTRRPGWCLVQTKPSREPGNESLRDAAWHEPTYSIGATQILAARQPICKYSQLQLVAIR